MGLSGALIESWALYAIAAVIVIVRIILRTVQLGFKGWQGDDYLAILAFIGFTYNTASFQLIEELGCNIGLTDSIVSALMPKQIRQMETGSMVDFFSWFAWITLLWSCKGCMLFLYSRVTMMLWQRKLVTIAFWFVGVTFVGGWVTNIFKCGVEVKRNWQVKPAPGQCPAGAANFYFVGITNFLTDALILSIPLPILWKVHLPTKKKIFIFFMLCSGLFIVVVSALRCVYSILSVYDSTNVSFALGWSTRENGRVKLTASLMSIKFTAMVIVNLPIIVTSLQILRYNPRSKNNSSHHHSSMHPSNTTTNRRDTMGGGAAGTDLHLVSVSGGASRRISFSPPGQEKGIHSYTVYAEADEEELLSEEEMRVKHSRGGDGGTMAAGHGFGRNITVVRTVTVDSAGGSSRGDDNV